MDETKSLVLNDVGAWVEEIGSRKSTTVFGFYCKVWLCWVTIWAESVCLTGLPYVVCVSGLLCVVCVSGLLCVVCVSGLLCVVCVREFCVWFV